MALYRYGDRTPRVGTGVFVSDSARVIGNVVIGDDCYIGHGAVLRGDYGTIHLGTGTAVEENAVVHIGPGEVSEIGERVTIGHSATVHAKSVGAFAVIGMGAVLSYDVEVGEWAIVAEGCVVPNGMTVPSGTLVVGVPAKIVGDVGRESRTYWEWGKQLYVDLAHEYPDKLEKLD
jgi:carbonic anhydrase/acetyltransferase-like protein (isoleucine patch superfamily)